MSNENTKDDKPAAREASLSAPPGSWPDVTGEWLYSALRPGKSWEHTANKQFWEGEAQKLRRALLNHKLMSHPTNYDAI